MKLGVRERSARRGLTLGADHGGGGSGGVVGEAGGPCATHHLVVLVGVGAGHLGAARLAGPARRGPHGRAEAVGGRVEAGLRALHARQVDAGGARCRVREHLRTQQIDEPTFYDQKIITLCCLTLYFTM